MMTADTKTTILDERKARGWSRARLAREAGVTEQTIVRAEKGLVVTSLGTVVRIAAALEVPVDSLVLERAHVSNLPEPTGPTPQDAVKPHTNSTNTNGTARGDVANATPRADQNGG